MAYILYNIESTIFKVLLNLCYYVMSTYEEGQGYPTYVSVQVLFAVLKPPSWKERGVINFFCFFSFPGSLYPRETTLASWFAAEIGKMQLGKRPMIKMRFNARLLFPLLSTVPLGRLLLTPKTSETREQQSELVEDSDGAHIHVYRHI